MSELRVGSPRREGKLLMHWLSDPDSGTYQGCINYKPDRWWRLFRIYSLILNGRLSLHFSFHKAVIRAKEVYGS